MCLLELQRCLKDYGVSLRDFELAFYLRYPLCNFMQTVNGCTFNSLLSYISLNPLFPLENKGYTWMELP